MRRLLLPISLLLLLCGGAAVASINAYVFDTPQHEQRFKKLIAELRCLVCQNQNLADSDADLAKDLKDEIYEMIQDGKSDAEIIDFMVARYGDFVLYRPPVKPITYMLWVGPFILFVLGAVVLVLFVRRRNQDVLDSGELSGEERQRLEGLLKEQRETPDSDGRRG
ncbi:MAG TPA: cytochrome c-type biogenesis protein CcmH [Gammaproteobacteria bacterium]|nr:cytochrome c-type biogenesis protein CcmH [Gammaproteobacteria bacterium]